MKNLYLLLFIIGSFNFAFAQTWTMVSIAPGVDFMSVNFIGNTGYAFGEGPSSAVVYKTTDYGFNLDIVAFRYI